MIRIYFIAAIALVFAASVTGCGGRKMADVRGQVTYEGQPVTSGVLIFSPVAQGDDVQPGKSATGDIQPDGTYRLSTYRRHDGAVIARHRVRYVPPYNEEDAVGGGPDVTAYRILGLPSEYQVDVQPGENEISIELADRENL